MNVLKCRKCGRVMPEKEFTRTKGGRCIDLCLECKSELSRSRTPKIYKEIFNEIEITDPEVLKLGMYCVQFGIGKKDIDEYIQNKVSKKREYFHNQCASKQ